MKLDNLDQDVEGVHALHVHVEYVDKFLRDEQKPLLAHSHQFELVSFDAKHSNTDLIPNH